MSDQDLPQITIQNIETKNRFPIAAQLVVLGVILVGLFGTVIFQKTLVKIDPPVHDISQTENSLYPIVPQKIDSVSVKAHSAYVWDVRSQRALYSKNATEEMPLASITKLMTSLVAHELVSESEIATVSLSAILQEGSSGLLAGERLTTENLRELALISSSNDAAFALAASVGGLLGDSDPTTQFVAAMNIRANELGLDSLHFKNVTGLDLSPSTPGAVGNARDVSFLMEHIIANYPDIIAPTTEVNTRVYNMDGEFHDVHNTNDVVLEIPNLIGSKTGYTDLAGGNLTIAFDVGLDRPIIVTVLGSTRDERFSDVITLVEAVRRTVSTQ